MQAHAPTSVFAIVLAAAALLPGRACAQLNDTGQMQCFDSAGATVNCTDDAGTHPGQDGRFGRDARAAAGQFAKACGGAAGFDFCMLDTNGAFAAPADAQCAIDQATGLIWSTQTLGASDWADANAAGASYVRCGISTGWRLPTRRDLLSIVDHGTTAPAIDGNAFPGTYSAPYWSADAYAPDPGQAWTIDFSDGDTLHAAQGETHLVRLVTPSVNQPPRITLGANIEVPRENRPAPLSFPGWATGIAPGPPREAGQHLTATLRLLPVTGQKALEFDVPPSLDLATGTLSFTIKHRIYPGTYPDDPNDPSYDKWYSSAGLARVQVTLQDDGGTAEGGVDTTVAGEFTIFLDPAPVARDVTIKHPWKAAAIPVTHGAFDADTDPNPDPNVVWPTNAWWWPQVRIITWPTKGVLTDYVSRPADADAGAGTQVSVSTSKAKLPGPVTAELVCTYDGVDQFWMFMYPTTPERHVYNGLSYNYNNTIVYVPFSTTFVGSDAYSYCVVDPDGNVSNIASVSIEIFEVRP
jgi:hypothetical protein